MRRFLSLLRYHERRDNEKNGSLISSFKIMKEER